jgi:hypothetical protein
MRPCLKKGRGGQVGERLPSKCKVLNSNSTTAKKKKKTFVAECLPGMLRALGSIPSMAKKTYPPNPKKNPTKIK